MQKKKALDQRLIGDPAAALGADGNESLQLGGDVQRRVSALATALREVGREERIGEVFPTFEAAVGILLEGRAHRLHQIPTNNPFMFERGYTEKWIGADPMDLKKWYSAFRNPRTGEYSGGHRSSHRE